MSIMNRCPVVPALLATLLMTTIAYAQEPEVAWEMATWSPIGGDDYPQDQDESGEDWAYDVTLTYASGSPDGYIFAGYTSYVGNYQFQQSSGFQCPEEYLDPDDAHGCARPKLFKTNLDGEVLWYQVYSQNEGELRSVIQTSDGGYLAVGRSHERGDRLTYYADSTSTNELNCETVCTRNIYAVKVDIDGDVVWEYLYGMADPNNSLVKRDSEAWDVVEMASGNFRIVGSALDPDDAARDAVSGFISKAIVLEISSSGVRQWIKPYGAAGNASVARGIARSGNNYAIVYSAFDQADFLEASADADIVVIEVPQTSRPSATDSVNLTASSGEHDLGTDVEYSGGYLYVAAVLNCSVDNGCFRGGGARGEGAARVYQLDPTDFDYNPDNTGDTLGTVKAYDLWATLTPTSDGGVLFVSTKQPDDPISELQEYFYTVAFVAKIDEEMDIDWSLSYDSETSELHNADGDKQQECLYGIAVAPDGGYVISGNNSSNWDDDYVVKFRDATSQAVDHLSVNNVDLFYFGPDELNLGPSFELEATACLDLVAESSISIVGPFSAELGSMFEAAIDPNHVGVTRGNSVGPFLHAPSGTTEQFSVGGTDARDYPLEVDLKDVYPNPFNPAASIRFALPEQTTVSLMIYDAVGRVVAQLVNGTMAAGEHLVIWNASAFPTGVYFCRLEAGSFTKTRSMIFLK